MWRKIKELAGQTSPNSELPIISSSSANDFVCYKCNRPLEDKTKIACTSCVSGTERLLEQSLVANKGLKEKMEVAEIQHKGYERETQKIQSRQSERIVEFERLLKEKDAIVTRLYSLLSKAYFEPVKIRNLYYITDLKNLPSILQKGILCKNSIEEKMLDYTSFADENIQAIRSKIQVGSRNGHDFVPLFFEPKPPMLYRLQKTYQEKSNQNELVYVCVRKEILTVEGILFTDRNLASSYCKFYDSIENLSALNWDVIRSASWAGDKEIKHIKGAEVLVPDCVNPIWFEKIVVYDETAQYEVYLASQTNLLIEVNRDGFYF